MKVLVEGGDGCRYRDPAMAGRRTVGIDLILEMGGLKLRQLPRAYSFCDLALIVG